jgi:hypothetical protein
VYDLSFLLLLEFLLLFSAASMMGIKIFIGGVGHGQIILEYDFFIFRGRG